MADSADTTNPSRCAAFAVAPAFAFLADPVLAQEVSKSCSCAAVATVAAIVAAMAGALIGGAVVAMCAVAAKADRDAGIDP